MFHVHVVEYMGSSSKINISVCLEEIMTMSLTYLSPTPFSFSYPQVIWGCMLHMF